MAQKRVAQFSPESSPNKPRVARGKTQHESVEEADILSREGKDSVSYSDQRDQALESANDKIRALEEKVEYLEQELSLQRLHALQYPGQILVKKYEEPEIYDMEDHFKDDEAFQDFEEYCDHNSWYADVNTKKLDPPWRDGPKWSGIDDYYGIDGLQPVIQRQEYSTAIILIDAKRKFHLWWSGSGITRSHDDIYKLMEDADAFFGDDNVPY